MGTPFWIETGTEDLYILVITTGVRYTDNTYGIWDRQALFATGMRDTIGLKLVIGTLLFVELSPIRSYISPPPSRAIGFARRSGELGDGWESVTFSFSLLCFVLPWFGSFVFLVCRFLHRLIFFSFSFSFLFFIIPPLLIFVSLLIYPAKML